MEELTEAGFREPSPIQKFAWPILSKGRDSVGIAQTGSGKTLSYLLPALSHISQQPPLEPGDGPVALVMGPTRELVQQIESEARKFGGITKIKSAVCYGGSGVVSCFSFFFCCSFTLTGRKGSREMKISLLDIIKNVFLRLPLTIVSFRLFLLNHLPQ